MARNGSGTYSLEAGQPVVDGTTISATVFNTQMASFATALTQSIASDGQTPITAPLRAVNGSLANPSYSWTASTATGLYSPGTDQAGMAAGGVTAMTWNNTGAVTALPITSTYTGAPFIVASTAQVANLNVARAGTADTLGALTTAQIAVLNVANVFTATQNFAAITTSSTAQVTNLNASLLKGIVYPAAAGASGNVLTSDGTQFLSSTPAPSSGGVPTAKVAALINFFGA